MSLGCNRLAVPQIWTSGPALRTLVVRKSGRSSEDVVLLNGYNWLGLPGKIGHVLESE